MNMAAGTLKKEPLVMTAQEPHLMSSVPQVLYRARPIPRIRFDTLVARAKGNGSPFTRQKATFFYQLQGFGLIRDGTAKTVAVVPGGALEPGPQRVRFSDILPGFDLLQATRNRRKNVLRLSVDGNGRQLTC
jgi:hypothetical protein